MEYYKGWDCDGWSKIKKEALERMINRIYKLERDNAKTCSYSDNKMKELIKQIIIEEANKCY